MHRHKTLIFFSNFLWAEPFPSCAFRSPCSPRAFPSAPSAPPSPHPAHRARPSGKRNSFPFPRSHTPCHNPVPSGTPESRPRATGALRPARALPPRAWSRAGEWRAVPSPSLFYSLPSPEILPAHFPPPSSLFPSLCSASRAPLPFLRFLLPFPLRLKFSPLWGIPVYFHPDETPSLYCIAPCRPGSLLLFTLAHFF